MIPVNVGHQHQIRSAEFLERCSAADRIDKLLFAVSLENYRAVLDRMPHQIALGSFDFIGGLAGKCAP